MSKAFEDYKFSNGLQRLAQKQRSAQIVKLDATTRTLSGSLAQLSTPQGVEAQAHKVLTGFDPRTGVFTLDQLDYSDLSGTPTFAAVAISGDYSDLTGTPTPQGGPTSGRPSSPTLYMQYFDTTLHYPVTWDGAAWRNGAGAIV